MNEPLSWPNRIDSIEILGDRAAIDGDEGLARAFRGTLDRARDQFLADAGFAFDQNGDIGLRGALSQPHHLAHLGALADQVVEREPVLGLLLEPRDFAGKRPDFERVADGNRDALRTRGFHEEIAGAGAHRFDRGIDSALRGQHDDGKSFMCRAQFAEDCHAVHVGHHEIEQQELYLLAARSVQKVESRLTAGSRDDMHARPRNGRFEQPALYGIVVNNQNCLRHVGIRSLRRGDGRLEWVKVELRSRFKTDAEWTRAANRSYIAALMRTW